jgi:hypothetical protein
MRLRQLAPSWSFDPPGTADAERSARAAERTPADADPDPTAHGAGPATGEAAE